MSIKEAMFYKKNSNNNVTCELCPHECQISNGNMGICRVRKNIDGKLLAASYGQVSSLALDPIEKKPLYNFYPGNMILSLGSFGCNLSCLFCQNSLISMGNPDTQFFSADTIAYMAKECKKDGNIGVAYTYNEPLIAYEYILDCAKAVHELGMKNVLVTNGFIQEEPLSKLLPYIDSMNIDLKSFNDEFYINICGAKLENILNTIKMAEQHCHIEITTLIITGENDSIDEIEEISKFISSINKEIPFHISRFFPMHKMQNKAATPVETIYSLANIARKRLEYVYTGNC